MPPLLPAIHRSLPLNEKAVGALTGLPILLLATATLLGSFLIARLGARRACILGLSLVAAGGALRGLGPSLLALFAMTVVMGLGIAIAQPSMPSLVAIWTPRRIAIATAAYSNGLLVGEILPAALTVPWVVALAGGSWQWTLAAWSAPVALTALAILVLTPHERPESSAGPARWLPDWGDPVTLRLGVALGAASAAYFGLNAFIPDYMRSNHHAALITPALTFLNLFQLPASFIVGGLAGHVLGRRWPFVATGALTVGAALALPLLPGIWQAVDAGLIGYAAAQVFMLVLAMPPLLAEAGDVHRITAGITTLQYTLAFLAPLGAGALWDASGWNGWPYAMVVLCGLAQMLAPLGMRFPEGLRTRGALQQSGGAPP